MGEFSGVAGATLYISLALGDGGCLPPLPAAIPPEDIFGKKEDQSQITSPRKI